MKLGKFNALLPVRIAILVPLSIAQIILMLAATLFQGMAEVFSKAEGSTKRLYDFCAFQLWVRSATGLEEVMSKMNADGRARLLAKLRGDQDV